MNEQNSSESTELSTSSNPYSSQNSSHDLFQQAVRKEVAKRSQFLWWIGFFLQPVLSVSLLVLLVVGLGLAQKRGWLHFVDHQGEEVAAEGEDVLYICPMVCVPPSTEPGKCPVCGMDLKPQKPSGDSKDKYGLRVDPASIRLAGIRTVVAESKPLIKQVSAIGQISYDEGTLASISAYVDGRIDKLYADFTGVKVKKGDNLAQLYSPELYSSQVALLEAIKLRSATSNTSNRISLSNDRLYESSKQRLIELGLTEDQVAQLQKSQKADSRISVTSPISGTVIQKMAVKGQYVKTGQVIYKVADLSTVWLMLELFPKDAANIRFGQKVVTTVQSLPGRKFDGRVAFIDPVVSPKTQTVRVRVVVPNKDGLIRVGDFATASISTTVNSDNGSVAKVFDPDLVGKWISPRHPDIIQDKPGKCSKCGIDLVPATSFGFSDKPIEKSFGVVIPRNSVLLAGDQSVAYVETESGRFEFREIEIGQIVGNEVSVVKGIEAGETVVASATLLIDSQFNMAGKPSLIDPNKAAPKGPEEADPFKSPEVIATLAKLPDQDRKEVEKQKICPVTEAPLGSMGAPLPLDVEGRKVWICCAGCEDRLRKTPKKYFDILDNGPTKKKSDSGSLPKIESIDDSDLNQLELPDDLDLPDLEIGSDDLPTMEIPKSKKSKTKPKKESDSESDLLEMELPELELPEMEPPKPDNQSKKNRQSSLNSEAKKGAGR